MPRIPTRRHVPKILGWLLLTALSSAAPLAVAQVAEIPTFHEDRFVHSGPQDGSGAKSTLVWREAVRAPGSPWIRLRLGSTVLGASSQLTIRSREDGDVQVLDAKTLQYWEHHTAYFNGDAVDLELHAGPDDRGVFVHVDRVTYSRRPGPEGDGALPKSICGSNDDRIPSNDPRVARLAMSSGFCTAWLIPNDAAASAGHCGDPDGNYSGAVLHFNVPMSDADGSPNMAAVADQYPVDSSTVSFEASGEGDDWAVFTVNPNSGNGFRAHELRGWFRLTSTLPAGGSMLRVTGHGIDDDPDGPVQDNCDDGSRACNSSSLTQQTDIGTIDGLDGESVEHHVDTMPANSGSPVIWEANGYAIAIHTDGGCDSVWSEYDNGSTWFGDGPLASAVQARNPSNRFWLDKTSPTVFQLGTVIMPFVSATNAIATVPNGANLQIYEGEYPATALNLGGDGRAMTLTGVWGDVVIGN